MRVTGAPQLGASERSRLSGAHAEAAELNMSVRFFARGGSIAFAAAVLAGSCFLTSCGPASDQSRQQNRLDPQMAEEIGRRAIEPCANWYRTEPGVAQWDQHFDVTNAVTNDLAQSEHENFRELADEFRREAGLLLFMVRIPRRGETIGSNEWRAGDMLPTCFMGLDRDGRWHNVSGAFVENSEARAPEGTSTEERVDVSEVARSDTRADNAFREGQVIRGAQWIARPDARELARYYPERAQELGIGGKATIECTVSAASVLSCIVTDEEPVGYGFGDAALRASRSFSVAPATVDGVPSDGGRVRQTLQWQPTAQ